MSTGKRIQRKRTKGWRMPENAVYVGRPTVWGNPYKRVIIEKDGTSRQFALKMYESLIRDLVMLDPDVLTPLRGKDLACWCPLDKPCHADVLLRILSESE